MTAETSWWGDGFAKLWGNIYSRAESEINAAVMRGMPPSTEDTLRATLAQSLKDEDEDAAEAIAVQARSWTPDGGFNSDPGAAQNRSDDPFEGTAQGVKAAAKEAGKSVKPYVPSQTTLWIVLAAAVLISVSLAVVSVKVR